MRGVSQAAILWTPQSGERSGAGLPHLVLHWRKLRPGGTKCLAQGHAIALTSALGSRLRAGWVALVQALHGAVAP